MAVGLLHEIIQDNTERFKLIQTNQFTSGGRKERLYERMKNQNEGFKQQKLRKKLANWHVQDEIFNNFVSII